MIKISLMNKMTIIEKCEDQWILKESLRIKVNKIKVEQSINLSIWTPLTVYLGNKNPKKLKKTITFWLKARNKMLNLSKKTGKIFQVLEKEEAQLIYRDLLFLKDLFQTQRLTIS